MNTTRISRLLSLVLRHEPHSIGMQLDPNGWVECSTLIKAAADHGMVFDQATLMEVVRTNDKQRFALSEDGTRIRANQGHSVKVDLELKTETPPPRLYHGTVGRFIDSIRTHGLLKGERQHVHLSRDPETASKVGGRRGTPVILSIRSQAMHEAGHGFFLSKNGVWLTHHVPSEFIEFPSVAGTTTLYRPVGPEELKLIEASGWTAFPPRLPDQPIFYPVTNEAYATQIARDWNVPASGSGFVTRFVVDSAYLAKFPVQTVGGRAHTELWIPAEELDEFNRHIIGRIEVTRGYP